MSLKIVVIEDNITILTLLREFLKEMGYTVHTFTNAREVSDFCKCLNGSSCADLIITDNHMPGMSGLELVQELLKRGCNGRNRYISIASGNWSLDEFNRAQSLGCKLLQKPYQLKELTQWIEDCKRALKN